MKILMVHQSSELYGSDRSFLTSVQILSAAWPQAIIDVIVPSNGPLVERLRPFVRTVEIVDLFILRKKGFGNIILNSSWRLPTKIFSARAKLRQYDLTYINTAVVMDYMIAVRWGFASIIHVREIPQGIARRIIRELLKFSKAMIIYNSFATKKSFVLAGQCREEVIHNGFEMPDRDIIPLGETFKNINILLIGRINSWKGHELIIQSISQLNSFEKKKIQLRFVGESFGAGNQMETKLEQTIAAAGLLNTVNSLPFAVDPSEHFEWADIVAIPSIKPEPFGRTAIEAMAFCRPVMAAAHGGLVEIVVDGETGWLVPPGSASSWTQAIRQVLSGAFNLRDLGMNGRRRYERLFTNEAYGAALRTAIEKCVSPMK